MSPSDRVRSDIITVLVVRGGPVGLFDARRRRSRFSVMPGVAISIPGVTGCRSDHIVVQIDPVISKLILKTITKTPMRTSRKNKQTRLQPLENRIIVIPGGFVMEMSGVVFETIVIVIS